MSDAGHANAARRREPAPRFEIVASVEWLLVAASVFFALSANRRFFGAALAGHSLREAATWGYVAALFALVVALHVLLLAFVANRWTVKPLLAALIVATALASFYMQSYGVYLDPSMMRNVLRTDPAEARELLSASLVLHLLVYALVPLLVLWRVRVPRRGLARATITRAALVAGAAALAVLSLFAVFQSFSSLMRNHKEVRYLITPANYLWSGASAFAGDARTAAAPRAPIGLDAAPGSSWGTRSKPMFVVLVVGETARAANWGLNGYARQTTPQLAALPVVNFADVTGCGTNTEVSLPCMFAPVGRRDYDESRIRSSESLLHVLARAGVGVHWRDNQSGCKGVCDGLPSDIVSPASAPGLCQDGRCLDEGLLVDLDRRLERATGTQLLVLHQLGNHGPSYFRRYPPAFAKFLPDCRDDDLRRCSVEQIVNAYDNALLYTDHVLASAIAKLGAHADRVDSALVYVSDHGESLGERGLFLHGVPYLIAPQVQSRVPMTIWFSSGFARSAGLSPSCLRASLDASARRALAHDNLFHTMLGLFDVRTELHESSLDLTGECRQASLLAHK